ncbi:MAG: hypothetical protein QME32_07535 [Endomicrobiia bacterium]|nr:hypothetical protein [Endomicrobiia bacterium]
MLKKMLVVCAVVSLAGSAFAADMVAKVNLDVSGSGKFSSSWGSMDMTAGMGFGIGAEVIDKVSDSVEVGGGLEYQMGRKIEKVDGVAVTGPEVLFNFVPIYGLVKVNFPAGEGATGFGKLQLGYSIIHSGNDAYKGTSTLGGGLHYGVGGGVVVSDVVLELMYSTYKGTLTEGANKADIDYTKIALSGGYKFKI